MRLFVAKSETQTFKITFLTKIRFLKIVFFHIYEIKSLTLCQNMYSKLPNDILQNIDIFNTSIAGDNGTNGSRLEFDGWNEERYHQSDQ